MTNKELDRFQVGYVISYMNCKSRRLERRQFKRGTVSDKDFQKMGQADAWLKAAEWIRDMIGDDSGLKIPAAADIDEVSDYIEAITPQESLFEEMKDYIDGFQEAKDDIAEFIAFTLGGMGKVKSE